MLSLLLTLLASPALARDALQGTLVEGVTAEQIAAARSPIPVATFTVKNTDYTLKCAGSGSSLACSVTNGKASRSVTEITGAKRGTRFTVAAYGDVIVPIFLGNVDD